MGTFKMFTNIQNCMMLAAANACGVVLQGIYLLSHLKCERVECEIACAGLACALVLAHGRVNRRSNSEAQSAICGRVWSAEPNHESAHGAIIVLASRTLLPSHSGLRSAYLWIASGIISSWIESNSERNIKYSHFVALTQLRADWAHLTWRKITATACKVLDLLAFILFYSP